MKPGTDLVQPGLEVPLLGGLPPAGGHAAQPQEGVLLLLHLGVGGEAQGAQRGPGQGAGQPQQRQVVLVVGEVGVHHHLHQQRYYLVKTFHFSHQCTLYNDITIFDSKKPDLLDEHLQCLGVPVLAPVPVSQHHRPQAPTQRCHQLAAHITRVCYLQQYLHDHPTC